MGTVDFVMNSDIYFSHENMNFVKYITLKLKENIKKIPIENIELFNHIKNIIIKYIKYKKIDEILTLNLISVDLAKCLSGSILIGTELFNYSNHVMLNIIARCRINDSNEEDLQFVILSELENFKMLNISKYETYKTRSGKRIVFDLYETLKLISNPVSKEDIRENAKGDIEKLLKEINNLKLQMANISCTL